MKKLSQFLRLSWRQQSLLLYGYILLNTIRLALWILPFGRVRKLLAKVSQVWCSQPSGNTVSVGFIVKVINLVSRYSPGVPRCLVRALTAQILLNHYGYSHQFHIGVAKNELDVFEAHAWIEYEGCVIVGQLSTLSRYRLMTNSTSLAMYR
ncbi:MAG: lasso peptide biosynthesis B2 protein [Phormidesmis sp. RL_2_1]|nr:lasso peptide biosynthesis B2 protein [Phormidesmis sp. RL_2_1]